MTRPRTRPRAVPRLATASAVAIVIASSVLAACSGDSDDDTKAARRSTTSTTTPGASAELAVRPGVVTVESAGPDVRLDRHTVFQITHTVNEYLRSGVTGPLLHGVVGPRFLAGFSDSVRPALARGQHDRGVLSDEGAPRITGPARAEGAPLDITGLADTQGTVVMATARLAMRLAAPTGAGEVSIARLGDLVLEPTADGHWRITGYSMLVLRDDGTATATTVAGAAPTPTTSGTEAAP